MSRVLVVEDELGFQDLLAEVLGGAGHTVAAAQTAAEALDRLRTDSFDLVLVDHRLPGDTGLDFLRVLRAQDPALPAIIMTAYAEVNVVVEAMRLGAVDFLVKPFPIAALLPLVERCLRPADPAGAP
jgi:DNA-binding NtrC family response regulator